MSQENVELAAAFFDAYNARDSEAVDRLLDPDAEIMTMTGRAGLPTQWGRGTTRQYFDQLDEAWADLRVEIEGYRDLGERVVALGAIRGAGKASHVEVATISRSCSSSGIRGSYASTPTTIGRKPSKPPGCRSR
jgi:ketosteroid isomerase-like protein